MAIDGSEFMDFTEWLQKQTSYNSEICYRCAINRAYYAAFHTTKNILSMGDRSNHGEVIKKLKLKDEYMGNQLEYFFEERKKADYRLGYQIRQSKATRLVTEIKEFLKDLSDLYGCAT